MARYLGSESTFSAGDYKKYTCKPLHKNLTIALELSGENICPDFKPVNF
ncbi:MAG: hypothetical protein WCB90_06835 [Methanosarcina sp.]